MISHSSFLSPFFFRLFSTLGGLAIFLILSGCGKGLNGSITVNSTGLASNAPTVTSIEYPEGPLKGGSKVVIKGNGFLKGARAFLGTSPCINEALISAGELHCQTTPHAPGMVDTVVVNWDDQQGILPRSYTYSEGPLILRVEPQFGSARGGTAVRVLGFFFKDGATVELGGSPCLKVEVMSSKELRCLIGNHAADVVDIKVINRDKQSGLLKASFQYRAEPNSGRVVASGTHYGDFSQDDILVVAHGDFLTGKNIMDIFFQEWVIELEPNPQ